MANAKLLMYNTSTRSRVLVWIEAFEAKILFFLCFVFVYHKGINQAQNIVHGKLIHNNLFKPELRGNRVRDGQLFLGGLPRWVAFKTRVDRDTSRD